MCSGEVGLEGGRGAVVPVRSSQFDIRRPSPLKHRNAITTLPVPATSRLRRHTKIVLRRKGSDYKKEQHKVRFSLPGKKGEKRNNPHQPARGRGRRGRMLPMSEVAKALICEGRRGTPGDRGGGRWLRRLNTLSLNPTQNRHSKSATALEGFETIPSTLPLKLTTRQQS